MNFIVDGNNRYRSSVRSNCAMLMLAISFVTTAGCSSTANYKAETMPSSLRIAKAVNPQEVDLSRLASNGTSSQAIGVGDVLEVTIAAALTAEETLTTPAQVDNNGRISLVGVGAVSVVGLEPDAAAAAIRSAVVQAKLYNAPQVTVLMKAQKQNYVRVIGAVKNPGLYALPPGRSDLLSALVAAGSLDEDAGTKVEIRNPANRNAQLAAQRSASNIQQTSYGHSMSPTPDNNFAPGQLQSRTIDLNAAAMSGGGAYAVADGGVVHVQKTDPKPISVIGLVSKPGEYDFPIGRDYRVLDALATAGGRSNKLADKIFVIRPLANQTNPAVIQVSLRQAKKSGNSNVRLAPGDTVSIEASPATVFMDAIQIIRFGVNGSLSTLF